jgi:hypothetical protein
LLLWLAAVVWIVCCFKRRGRGVNGAIRRGRQSGYGRTRNGKEGTWKPVDSIEEGLVSGWFGGLRAKEAL